jgi:hypothetical protein
VSTRDHPTGRRQATSEDDQGRNAVAVAQHPAREVVPLRLVPTASWPGGRRLAALQRVAKAKAIAKTEEIACQEINGEDAAEISLACGCRCTPPRSLSSRWRAATGSRPLLTRSGY